MSDPVNHHFVPQHFLRAWASNADKSLIGRYRYIDAINKVVFDGGKSIARVASADNLYTLTDGQDAAQFETSVMTEALDTPTSPLIEKVRDQGFASLRRRTTDSDTLSEAEMFLRYVIALETRNPKTIAVLGMSADEISAMGDDIDPSISIKSRDEVIALLQSLNVNTLISGLLVQNDDTFKRLLSANTHELNLDQDLLFTSNYPVGRLGIYDRHFLVVLATSPRQALFWGNGLLLSELAILSPEGQAKAVNFLTLKSSDEIYYKDKSMISFVSENWNWNHGLSSVQEVQRFGAFLKTI